MVAKYHPRLDHLFLRQKLFRHHRRLHNKLLFLLY